MSATPETRPHAAVVVQVGDQKAEIDEALAPLIRELWLAGIETLMCCQEYLPGRAWIEFTNPFSLQRFLNLVATFEISDDSVYDRVAFHLHHPEATDRWDYRLNAHDQGGHENEDETVGHQVDITFTAEVEFPLGDLPTVILRMQQHNAGTAQRI